MKPTKWLTICLFELLKICVEWINEDSMDLSASPEIFDKTANIFLLASSMPIALSLLKLFIFITNNWRGSLMSLSSRNPTSTSDVTTLSKDSHIKLWLLETRLFLIKPRICFDNSTHILCDESLRKSNFVFMLDSSIFKLWKSEEIFLIVSVS